MVSYFAKYGYSYLINRELGVLLDFADEDVHGPLIADFGLLLSFFCGRGRSRSFVVRGPY